MHAFDAAVRASTELAVLTALGLAALAWSGGPALIAVLTDLSEVRAAASGLMPFVAGYIICAVWAFQLDGIFVGATRTRDMRNAALVAVAAYLLVSWPLVRRYGNHGLWLAFIAYSIARVLSLGSLYRRLRDSLSVAPR